MFRIKPKTNRSTWCKHIPNLPYGSYRYIFIQTTIFTILCESVRDAPIISHSQNLAIHNILIAQSILAMCIHICLIYHSSGSRNRSSCHIHWEAHVNRTWRINCLFWYNLIDLSQQNIHIMVVARKHVTYLHIIYYMYIVSSC